MKRGDLIKTDKAIGPVGGKMSPSELLALFDELWRIEHQDDVERLKVKERKAMRLRAALVSLSFEN
jgi:hypothetical protein